MKPMILSAIALAAIALGACDEKAGPTAGSFEPKGSPTAEVAPTPSATEVK